MLSVTVAVTDTDVVVASVRTIAELLFKVTALTTGATLFTVKYEFEPCVASVEGLLYWSTIKAYASLEPSGVTDGILYVHEGFEEERVLEHHSPLVHAPFVIEFVLQTKSLTVLLSGSEAVAFHVIDPPGFAGEVFVIPVKDGRWLT